MSFVVTVNRENQKINKEEKQGHDKGPSAISFCVRVFVQFDVIHPVEEFPTIGIRARSR